MIDTLDDYLSRHARSRKPRRQTGEQHRQEGRDAQESPGFAGIVETTTGWPKPLAEEAYYGLAGDIVRAIEPYTESDPAALLLQLLTGFGNIIGRTAHYQAEGHIHYL